MEVKKSKKAIMQKQSVIMETIPKIINGVLLTLLIKSGILGILEYAKVKVSITYIPDGINIRKLVIMNPAAFSPAGNLLFLPNIVK